MSPGYSRDMMPGGHFVTSVALSGAAYSATGSIPAAAGCFLGGFLIDVDHYVDYLFVEGQWRRPLPSSFLRYYFESRPTRLVLPLHSWELMALLGILAIGSGFPLLTGYLAGALMHIFFDILINGEHGLRHPVKFYSFLFRAVRGFSSEQLVWSRVHSNPDSLNSQFWRVRPRLYEE